MDTLFQSVYVPKNLGTWSVFSHNLYLLCTSGLLMRQAFRKSDLTWEKLTDATGAQTLVISLDKLDQIVLWMMLWITACVKRLLKACLSAFPKRQRGIQIGRERTRETERDQGNECCAFLIVAPVEHSLQMKSSRKELFVGGNWNTFLKRIKFGNCLYFFLRKP